MGLWFAGSAREPFLGIRMVEDSFHCCGILCARIHRLKMTRRIEAWGSMRRRWRYSTLSFPGDEFFIVLRHWQISWLENGASMESSMSMDGTRR